MFLLPSSVLDSQPALRDDGADRWLTHGELRRNIESLVSRLEPAARGVVFVEARNRTATVTGYLAAMGAGHVVFPFSPDQDDFLRQLIETYRPESALTTPPLDRDGGVWTRAGYVAEAVTDDLVRWRPRSTAAAPPPHPDLALLLSTSGTTGSPKLVRLSRRNVLANATAIREALGITPAERAIASLPMTYSYGLSVLHSHLVAGASVALTELSILERPFWDRVRAWECTSCAGVPYMYEMLRRIGFSRFDLPSLRTMTQAGGRLADAVIAEFSALLQSRGGQFIVMYGQTEATARISVLPGAELPHHLGWVGYALPGGTLTVEVDGRSAPPDQPGEVVYQGPNVMMGYALEREDLGGGDELGGFLATGDVGILDANGCLKIVGRAKRFAKLYGLRVNLDEVENLLRRVAPAAVLSDDSALQIFCDPHGEGPLREALPDLASKLRLHPRSFQIRVVPALPLLSNGKVDYRALGIGETA